MKFFLLPASHIQPQMNTATVQGGAVDSEPFRPTTHTLSLSLLYYLNSKFNPSPQKYMNTHIFPVLCAVCALNLMKQDISPN